MQQPPLKNWAGNITYSTSNVLYPESIGELQSIVQKSKKLKALGTRHCFNTIADSHELLVSTAKLNKALSLDSAARTVTVEGGIKYGELAPWLNDRGFALHNLASLPHISVAGSCGTATHGSGVTNGNLTSAVRAFDLIRADGTLIHIDRIQDPERFEGLSVHLGAAGIVTKVWLDVQPTYQIRQNVFERLPMNALTAHFDEILSAGYSVSLFTDWTQDYINEVWIKAKMQGDKNFSAVPEFFGAKAATKNLHPIAANPSQNCTEQMGVPGPWHERLPHFKMGFTPSNGEELQSEYFVPHDQAERAIADIAKLGPQISPHLFITEIRTIKTDNFWMSPCYKRDAVTIHFTWKPQWEAVRKLLPVIEATLAPYHARPHWGKLYTLAAPTFAARYEKFGDFKRVIHELDPTKKFENDYLLNALG